MHAEHPQKNDQRPPARARRAAAPRRNTQLEPEHLLLALVNQDNGVVPIVLEKLGAAPRQVADRLNTAIGAFGRTQTPQQVYVSSSFRQMFERAQQEAEQLKDE